MSLEKLSDTRRGSIKRGLGLAAGAFIAGGNASNGKMLGTAAQSAERIGRDYPSDTMSGAIKPYQPSPREESLKKLIGPLHEQMQKIEQDRYGRYMRGNVQPYQSALRSTSDHWKQCIAHDRYMAGQSEMDRLQAQIRAIAEAPENMLVEALEKGIGGLLAALTGDP